jgi:hypothetical protein
MTGRPLPATLAFVILALLPTVVLGQSEPLLRRHFEGRQVVIRIDMPGTSDGLDVRPDGQIDPRQHADRLTRFGVAIGAGESATVTLVKLKKDLIEFQLNGGGYGTFGDDTSTSVDMPDVEKTNREKDLERQVKDEGDAARKRALQREFDDLRRSRERENRRISVERTIAADAKRRLVASRRLEGGSRFNIRYPGNVPPAVSPDDITAALAEYVDFSPAAGRSLNGEPAALSLRKGLLRADAERLLGTPVESSARREGTLRVVSAVFVRGDERITADFVEDVLIRYTIVVR